MKINVKSLDEFKRDAFRRRVVASCLAEEYSTKTSEIKNNIETIEMNTDLIVSSLKNSKEYYKEWISKLGQSKIESANKERAKEIEKYLKIFEENHKKIDNEYEKQVKHLDELLKIKLKEIEERYEYYSYTLDPMNDPSYYLLETIKEKGIDPSFVAGNKDIDIELGSKLYEYTKKIKEYEMQRDQEKETAIRNFNKARNDLEMRFKEFRTKVEEKENLIIEKINENYDKKINEIESETLNSINSKIQSIDITIASIENKKESTVSKFDSEIVALKKEFKAKIESLMQPLSPIPDELLSKYIYCKIEIKKPEIKVEQKVEEVKEEEKKDTAENKDAAKELEDAKIAASQPQPTPTSENKARYWNADDEKRKKFKERFNAFCRYVRTVFYATTLSSLFILILKDRLNTPTDVNMQSNRAITSISNTVKSIEKEIQNENDKKEVKEEKRKGASNEEVSIPNESTKRNKTDAEKNFDKLFISVEKQLDEYNAARFNFETQLELFESYAKEIKPSFGEVIGISRGKKNAANELLQKLKRLGDGFSKEKMNLIADALANARLYDISELGRYVDQIIRKDDDQLFGVDPTGKFVLRIRSPKPIYNPQEMQHKTIQSMKAEEQNQAAIDMSSDTIKSEIEQTVPKDNTENDINKIDNIDNQNVPNNDPEANDGENIDKVNSNNDVLSFEELTDAIIMCGNKAVVIKTSPGYIPNDDDPNICGRE